VIKNRFNNFNLILLIFISFSIINESVALNINFPEDSLEVGKSYRIYLYGGFETEGKIISIDSIHIRFKSNSNIYNIPKDQIKSFERADLEIIDVTTDLAKPSEDTTETCDVYLRNRTMLKDVELMLLNDSIIIVFKKKVKKEIRINDINAIKFKSSGFWSGFGYGVVINVAVWTLAGLIFPSEGEIRINAGVGFIFGLITAIPAGLIGGLIGAISASDVTYTFKGLNSSVKSKRVKYIIKKHS
jgi:hypothetical protein